MRTCLTLVFGVAILVNAGCSRKKYGNIDPPDTPPTKRSDPSKGSAEMADEATAEQIKKSIDDYCGRIEVRLRGPEVLRVAKPKELGTGRQAVWVQLTYINNFNEIHYGHHELFVLKDGQVFKHHRYDQEVENDLGAIWLRDNPPPPWPSIPKRTE
ncbi:MAG: hypothetical protein K2R98_17505 [Gemmataceae bacterium]|nr:hypothetical protein [Gemmataceae bacterium]